MHEDFWVTPKGSTPITASLGETDATHMFIDLSQSFAPEGQVSFIITNDGTKDHELVALATDTMAADFPIDRLRRRAEPVRRGRRGPHERR